MSPDGGKDFQPVVREVNKPVEKVSLKAKIQRIFNKRENQTPTKTFEELSSLEVIDINPDKSEDDTISIFDPDYVQKIKDLDEAQRLSQQIKSEATKDSEKKPIEKTLFPNSPNLYEQHYREYKKEKNTINGAIDRLVNIRRLQKEGFSRSDAREVYDSLRSRGIPDYQIRIPQEDFYGNLYKDKPQSGNELITLLKNAPKIIDRLNSLGLMELPYEFDTRYLSDDILTLTDAQFLQKKEQISRLFFVDKSAISRIMSQSPFEGTTLSFIDYFSTEFLIQQNQKIDFSIFQSDFLDLFQNTENTQSYRYKETISNITKKLIISDVNQDSTIKIHESLVPQEIQSQSTKIDIVFSILSKMPGRIEQKYLLNVYRQLEEGKISQGDMNKLIKNDGSITIEFINKFIRYIENTADNHNIASSLLEMVTISDTSNYESLKSLLSNPEIFNSFSPEDQKFWTKILTIGQTPYLNFLIRNKNTINLLVDQNNKPTLELLFKLIEAKSDFSTIISVCTPELVDKLPNSHPDKLFFTLISRIDSQKIYDFLSQNKDSVLQRIKSSSNPQETLTQYLSIIEQIDSSPSKEILKIKDQLLIEILNNPNPFEAYQKISDIFIKNNLPMIGKISKVFSALYPQSIMESKLDSNKKLSRVLLTHRSSRLRQSIIYNDLLKTNLESGEISLVNYLNLLNQSAAVLDKAKTGILLSPAENQQLSFFFKKLDTLYDSSLLSRIQPIETLDTSTIQTKISELYQKYKVKDGQSLSDRVVEMYFSSIGIKTISEALDYIKKSKETAHSRNLKSTQFIISEGDLIKNIDSENLSNILNFGSVAREYLGADADSDATPFDTDTMRSNGEYSIENFKQVATSGYGDIYIVVKNRGQFQDTTDDPSPQYDPSKLEVFQSGIIGVNHYGVRTGFPSSEIDFIITPSDEPRKLENIFYEIAKHGVYIPVLDGKGELIFTPQDYEKYRHSFDGVKQFGGDPIVIEKSQPSDPFYQEVTDFIKSIQLEQVDSVSLADTQIKEKIKTVFDTLGISFKDQFDTSILGSRLYNIGSSGRRTNLPGNFDFDYNIVLDVPNYSKLNTVVDEIKKHFSHQDEIPSELNQIRLIGVSGVSPETIDLDIGINTTASTLIFASHEAIEQKLDAIRLTYGEDTYQEVIANILLAKKILKENHAYKKGDNQDGGFGGIGTENWILSNSGSIKKAFETFWQAAHDNGRELTLDEFRKRYFILDPGENLRETGRSHDNFVFALQDKGYKAMLKAIGKYIS